MEEIGKVAEKEDGIVVVHIPIKGHCSHCGMSGVCTASGRDYRSLRARNIIDAKIGDTVKLKINPGKRLSLSFLVFGLPVLLGIIGILMGQPYGDLGTVIGAIIGLGAGLLIVKLVDILWGKQELPEVIEICKEQ